MDTNGEEVNLSLFAKYNLYMNMKDPKDSTRRLRTNKL